jgi:tetratricopeptide (TPR) repeat protein
LVTSVFPEAKRRVLTSRVLLALLCWSLPYVWAQAAPQFSDLESRATAAREARNIPLAIELYSRAEKLRPDWKEGWWYIGVLQYNSGQYAGSIDALNRLLQLVPTAAPAMALRGLCEFETRAYDDSLRDLGSSVDQLPANDPQNEQIIRFHLAQLLTHAGRFQDALDQYRTLAVGHIVAPDLMWGISLAGMRIPRFPWEIPAEDRDLYRAAGTAAYSLLGGDSEKADDLFAGIFAAHPSAPHLHFLYGFLLFPHDPHQAAEQLSRELALNPEDEYANTMFALTLVLSGQFADALEPARRAYAFAPNLEFTQLALGRALAETGDARRGAELLHKVIERDPGNLEAHLGLASIYSQTGNREEADREREVCRELSR